MRLNLQGLADSQAWKDAHIILPAFDIAKMREHTSAHPIWVHFGAGNIFRGFIAALQNKLLDEGLAQSGIIAAETFDYDIIRKIYDPFDNLTLMVTLRASGNMDMNIIASIAQGICADSSDSQEWEKLRAVFVNPRLQMVSYTITEKGYALRNIKGELMPVVVSDMNSGPDSPKHAMSITASLLLDRFRADAQPIAIVSMDNCSHNGEKLRNSVLEVADAWVKNGFVDKEYFAWLSDESQVSFPWSMIDKITPRPAEVVEAKLRAAGVEDMSPIITSRNTYIAPFVNAEAPQYLVIEDNFPNGRPPLEKAGVYMTDRDTVNMTERMKVTTCLNPLHTALAVYGCMLGYTKIADEMNDPELKKLVELIGYKEGLPVVTDPKILDPKKFIDEVVGERLPNAFMPDTPQRIATDTSQKIPVRFGETLKSYAASETLDIHSLTAIPLALAGWLRYLAGVDDNGEAMQVSADPMLETLQNELKTPEGLREILSNKNIFGLDLYEAGLAEKVTGLYRELSAGKGAVRATLKKYLA
ncbi:MAG: mannitol dehydrogenase family protein [Synergistaceae bacterium]|nr:mannitol dehydrogenase family protein [Synergistaceae bacterium]